MNYATIRSLTLYASVLSCGNEPDTPHISQERFVSFPTPRDDTFDAETRGDEDLKVSSCEWDHPNLVLNGTFEYRPIHACGWNTYDASDWGLVCAPYCVDDEREGCSIYIEAKVWGDPWVAQFYQVTHLRPEQNHILSFEAKAAGNARSIEVAIMGSGDPNNLGAGIEFGLKPEWHNFELSFRTTSWKEESVLIFAIGGAPNGLYLDNVSVIEME